MFSRSIPYKADTSRRGSGAAAVLGIFLAVYVGVAVCFYWLMQPTVVTNQGLAAFRPPPNTIVSSFLVPSAPSEPLTAVAEPAAPEVADTPVAPPKKATVKREAREARTTTAPRPQRPVREYERPAPSWGYASSQPQGSWGSQHQGYASSQPQGSRPWF